MTVCVSVFHFLALTLSLSLSLPQTHFSAAVLPMMMLSQPFVQYNTRHLACLFISSVLQRHECTHRCSSGGRRTSRLSGWLWTRGNIADFQSLFGASHRSWSWSWSCISYMRDQDFNLASLDSVRITAIVFQTCLSQDSSRSRHKPYSIRAECHNRKKKKKNYR